MIVPYTELPPAAGGGPRPLLDLGVADVDDVRVPCLLDSGSLNTLLPNWLAATAGVSLRRLPRRSLGVGGTGTTAAFVVTRLSAANHTWEAEVGFCDPWPYAWGLLGQSAFFRYFTVTFRAVDFEFEVVPVDA